MKIVYWIQIHIFCVPSKAGFPHSEIQLMVNKKELILYVWFSFLLLSNTYISCIYSSYANSFSERKINLINSNKFTDIATYRCEQWSISSELLFFLMICHTIIFVHIVQNSAKTVDIPAGNITVSECTSDIGAVNWCDVRNVFPIFTLQIFIVKMLRKTVKKIIISKN